MAKIKTMNDKAQLEEAGVVLDGKWALDAYGCYKPNRRALINYLTDLDGTQAVNRFKFLGCEKCKTIPWHLVEQMSYHRAKLLFHKVGHEFKMLPFVANGELNEYGQMTKGKPVPYNGAAKATNYEITNSKEYSIDYYGDLTELDKDGKPVPVPVERKGVVFFDRQNGFTRNSELMPKAVLQQYVINEIANRLSFLNINLVNSQGKNIIIVKDPKSAKAVERQLQAIYASDKSYSVVKSTFEVQVINNEIDYAEQELWEDVMSWNNLRLEGLGITNNGLFNKKERQLTIESSSDEEQTEVVTDAFFEARKEFVRNVIAVFGDDPDFKEQFDNFRVVDLRVENAKEKEPEQPVDNEEYEDEGVLV